MASSVALVVVAATLLLSWARLFLGVDLTDESFYIALPYRFALGDMPIRDEQNLGQMAGLLLLPFVRLFLEVAGGAEGIVLYVRHLHLAFTALVGLSVYVAVRPALPRRHALLAGALSLVFVPFNIHSLSYNTLGSGFLTIGCFMALVGGRRAAWGLAGVAHGLAILVYPTLAAVALAMPIAVLATEEKTRRWRLVGAYVAGGLLVALVPAWLMLRAGFDAVRAIPTYLAGFHAQGGALTKLRIVAEGFWGDVPQPRVLLSAMAVLALSQLWRPRPVRWALPLLPLLMLVWWDRPDGTHNLLLIVALALLGPFVYPLVRGQAFAGRLMRRVWLPSFLAGLVTAWSSGNGVYNACIGIFPAALASVVFMQMALARMPFPGVREVPMLAVPVLMIVPLLKGGYADYYGEGVQLPKLTEQVQAGPYKHLYTQPERRALLQRFEQEVRPLLRPTDRVLVFNDWPGGYLLAGARPGVNSVWLPPASAKAPVDRQATYDYWRKTGNEPTIALVMKQSEGTPDPLLALLTGPAFQPVADLGVATLRRRVAPLVTIASPAAAP